MEFFVFYTPLSDVKIYKKEVQKMEQQSKAIAARLKWARENLEIPASAMAEACGIGEAEYVRMEKGENDFSFSFYY